MQRFVAIFFFVKHFFFFLPFQPIVSARPFVVINVNAFLFMTCEAAPAGGPIPISPIPVGKNHREHTTCQRGTGQTLCAITSNAAFE